jgi:hypothetical protein
MSAQDPRALLQAAATSLARGRAAEARPAIDALSRMAPERPEVQYLVRSAAVIGFGRDASRIPLKLGPRKAPSQSSLDLVAFHVDLPAAPSGIHGQIDYMAVLALSFESARLRAPSARRILITDDATRVPPELGVDEVKRYALDRARPMFERMRVQELYLRGREAGRASVLMDSDVVVNADPTAIFTTDFDVGLTWRPEFPDAPFNGGMIFVAEADAGRQFFVDALACYEALAADPGISAAFPAGIKPWWGDQFALAATVGYREFAERQGDALEVNGRRIGFFPCTDFNFTIEANRQYSLEELRGKAFIHFKGNRKAMQSQYMERMRAGAL